MSEDVGFPGVSPALREVIADVVAQARREGAAEALEAAATDVLLDDSAGDYGTHVWLKMRAKALRGDA